jgi:hypothetical protein
MPADLDMSEAIRAVQAERAHWRMPRPIDTAPKDGTRILGHDRSGWREMWWKEDLYEGSFWQDEFDSEPEPTHWLPLPDKPE